MKTLFHFPSAVLLAALFFVAPSWVHVAHSEETAEAGDESIYEWVIESHSFPNEELVSGFTSEERGELRAPRPPAEDADAGEWVEFIRRSHSVVAHYLESLGFALPEGALVVYDPDTSTLVARLPRMTQWSIALLARNYFQDSVAANVRLELAVVEASAGRIRGAMESATETRDHTEILAGLKQAAGRNEARVVAAGSAITRSGLPLRLIEQDGVIAPAADQGFVVNLSTGLIDLDMIGVSGGTIWEIDPVIGANRESVDLNISLMHHHAPPEKRSIVVVKPKQGEVSANVYESYSAELRARATVIDGETALIGAWHPFFAPGVEKDSEVMRAAFLRQTIVNVMPLANEVLLARLEELGDEVASVPEGPLDFGKVAEEVPEGMIVRRYHVPPDLLTSAHGDAGMGVDPFAAAPAREPRFTIQATAKDLLASLGIAFPEGSSANYIPNTHVLVMRNTPENIRHFEALISSSLRSDPTDVRCKVHVVKAPAERLLAFAEEARGLADHSVLLKELMGEEGVEIEASGMLLTRSGLPAQLNTGRNGSVLDEVWTRERVALRQAMAAAAGSGGAAEGGDAEKETDAGGGGTVDVEASNELFADPILGASFAADFRGMSLGIEPVITASRRVIDVNFGLQMDAVLPEFEIANGREEGWMVLDGPAAPLGRRELRCQVSLLNGAVQMLGMWGVNEAAAGGDGEHSALAIFVRLDAISHREPFGKIEETP